jgi:hypothetical protein
MHIAIQQPYLYPYAGYFRLFAFTDIFVIYDDVQFNRRGRVHRCQLTHPNGTIGWLTLPIKKTDRDTTMIKDLKWQDHAKDRWKGRTAQFHMRTDEALPKLPINFVINSLEDSCRKLGLPFNCVRSSGMEIPPELRGPDRIIRICEKLGATQYLNSPGGRHLYEEEDFERHSIVLSFLPEFENKKSIVERLAQENSKDVLKEILENI